MQVAFTGLTLEQYDDVIKRMGFEPQGAGPPGSVFHWATKTDDGIRVIDVWETQEDFDTFAEEKIGPITQAAGMRGQARDPVVRRPQLLDGGLTPGRRSASGFTQRRPSGASRVWRSHASRSGQGNEPWARDAAITIVGRSFVPPPARSRHPSPRGGDVLTPSRRTCRQGARRSRTCARRASHRPSRR